MKIGNTLISHRILSAQEAVYRTTGLHLRGSTRSTIFINTSKPDKRVKSTHQLRELDESDTNVFQTGLFECYASRPSGDPFDTMSLSHFAVWYGISKTSVNEATSSRAQPRYQLQNNMGCIYLRRKQACLRVPTVTMATITIIIYSCYIYHGGMRRGIYLAITALPWNLLSPTKIGFKF